MSCNYAEGLSAYENKGKLGIPEIFDDEAVIEEKVTKLAEWVREAQHVVVHTGAGISTSGIPDFRGPNGVWTLEEKGLKPNINVSFESAKPTETHMGLVALIGSGHVKYIISQNIDGLHLRSGVQRNNISELHGNMFIAHCGRCNREFIQPHPVPTVGQKEIGLHCPSVKPGGRICRGKLQDNILDWEHNLPDNDLNMADMHSTIADLSICLGSTLQIIPAGNLPLKAKKNGGKLVIVNLQPTKHHKKADLVIHAYVNTVIKQMASILGISIPLYTPEIDPTCRIRSIIDTSVSKPKPAIDWTITHKDVARLKKQVVPLKHKPKKKTTRKRRRPPQRDDSSDESDSEENISFLNTSLPLSRKAVKIDTEGKIKVEEVIVGNSETVDPVNANSEAETKFSSSVPILNAVETGETAVAATFKV